MIHYMLLELLFRNHTIRLRNIDLYRQKIIVACIGQDKSEYDLLCSTRELDTVLAQKNIPHWFDYWGFDVTHDWVWWRKQIPYFFEHIFGKV